MTPCCAFDKRAYALTFGFMCIPFLILEVLHVLPSIWREPDMIPWASVYAKGALPFYYDQSAAFVALAVTMWLLSFFTIRGIRDHYRVDEDDSVTCLKTACYPDGMFCCQPFFMAQVARHVDDAQGFKPSRVYTTEYSPLDKSG